MQHISRSLQAFVVIRSGEMDKNSDIEYVTIHTPFLAKSLRIVWCYFLSLMCLQKMQNSSNPYSYGWRHSEGQRDRVFYYFILHLELKVLKIVWWYFLQLMCLQKMLNCWHPYIEGVGVKEKWRLPVRRDDRLFISSSSCSSSFSDRISDGPLRHEGNHLLSSVLQRPLEVVMAHHLTQRVNAEMDSILTVRQRGTVRLGNAT